MSSNAPAPPDGAASIPTSAPRSRSLARRIVLPIVTAGALTVVTSGTALACVQPSQQPKPTSTGGHSLPCHTAKPVPGPSQPETGKPTSAPSAEETVAPTTTQSLTPTQSPSKDTSKDTCTESSGNGDVCHVVSGSPSFTG